MAEKIRKRRRLRSTRKLRVFLLSIGLTALVLGIGLYGASVMSGNVKLRRFGVAYVIVSLVVLGVRQAFVHLDKIRKRKYVKR